MRYKARHTISLNSSQRSSTVCRPSRVILSPPAFHLTDRHDVFEKLFKKCSAVKSTPRDIESRRIPSSSSGPDGILEGQYTDNLYEDSRISSLSSKPVDPHGHVVKPIPDDPYLSSRSVEPSTVRGVQYLLHGINEVFHPRESADCHDARYTWIRGSHGHPRRYNEMMSYALRIDWNRGVDGPWLLPWWKG